MHRQTVFLLAALHALILSEIALPQQNTTGAGRRCWLDNVLGEVKVRRGSSPRWIDARPRMPIRSKDAVRTFVESGVVVVTSEGTKLSLGENSTVEMAEFLGSDPSNAQTKVKVLSGKLLSDVKKLTGSKSRFEFETPTATAAIRGTRVGFDVTVERTDIRVYEGKVLVRPKGSQSGAELKSNQMTQVAKGQRTVAVKEFKEPPPEELVSSAEKVKADTSIVADTVTTLVDSVRQDSLVTDSVPVEDGGTQDDSTDVDTTSLLEEPASDSAVYVAENDSLMNAPQTELSLELAEPAEGSEFQVGAPISVSGTVNPPEAKVLVRGRPVKVGNGGAFDLKVPGPAKAGDYSLPIEASFEGKTRKIVRNFTCSPLDESGLKLEVATPADGSIIRDNAVRVSGMTTPGAAVMVNGTKIVAGSDGAFRYSLPITGTDSEVPIDIEAVLGDQSTSLTRTVRRKSSGGLTLSIRSPADGERISKTEIPVTGTTTPGAKVTVNGIPAAVGPAGGFAARLPIPDEKNIYELEIRSELNGEEISENIQVQYVPVIRDVRLTVNNPPGDFQTKETRIPVAGRVEPADARIMINGRSVANRNGTFATVILIPDDPGEHDIDIEAEFENLSATQTRTVVYDPAGNCSFNTEAPILQPSVLQPVVNQSRMSFSVIDRTPHDEIKFHHSVDGGSDYETGVSGGVFGMEFLPGLHDYEIYAEDMCGNKSAVLRGKVSYMPSRPIIRMRNPSGDKLIRVPPSRHPHEDGAFEPIFTVEFSIENLPGDDYRLLKEVVVRNNGAVEASEKTFTDVDFDFDIQLRRGANVIVVEARDSQDRVVRRQVTVRVR